MAPTPVEENNSPIEDNSPAPQPSSAAPAAPQYWTKANIALTAVFALLALAVILVLVLFFFRKRAEKRKLRNRKSDRAGLLDNEDKTSMFSRERHSSVTYYVDPEADAQSKRASQETTSLIPLQVTPLDEVHDPMNHGSRSNINNNSATSSTGSGVSSISRLSTNTTSTMMLSPLSPHSSEGDLSIRPSGRPRSTSTSSQKARYYESTPTNNELPPIPKIIRTPSD